MKTDTLLIIAAAGLGLFFIARVAKGISKSTSPESTGAGRQTAAPDTWSRTPNGGLTLAQQYGEYGAGQAVANVYDQAGYFGTTK